MIRADPDTPMGTGKNFYCDLKDIGTGANIAAASTLDVVNEFANDVAGQVLNDTT